MENYVEQAGGQLTRLLAGLQSRLVGPRLINLVKGKHIKYIKREIKKSDRYLKINECSYSTITLEAYIVITFNRWRS